MRAVQLPKRELTDPLEIKSLDFMVNPIPSREAATALKG
jgi:hypothetical protein